MANILKISIINRQPVDEMKFFYEKNILLFELGVALENT